MRASSLIAIAFVAGAGGCGDDSARPDTGVDAAADAALCEVPGSTPDPMECAPSDGDYAPGNGAYGPCVSDDGRYAPIEATISTVGRVRAFEEIRALLFGAADRPSPEDFTAARLIYQEDEGLDSRIVRRYDPHFDVPAGTDCSAPGVPDAFPDYCVGPAKLQPIALAALNAGIAGEMPSANAGRLEGALLWFLYVSTYKEGLTCTTTPRDCDSAWAYYTGGEAARCAAGLASYVAAFDAYAHDRAWDGALALRCWRDLDRAEVATDLVLRDRARAQYDRAILDGVAAIVKARLLDAAVTTEDAQAFYWGSATILGRALERAMEAESPSDAAAFREELASDGPAAADIERAITAIDAVFSCP